MEKKEKKEVKRLKKEAKKNGEYEPLPEVYSAEEETSPNEATSET